MFVLEDYKKYLVSHMKLQYFKNPNCKYTQEDFIESLIYFGPKGHGSRLGSRPGDQIKSLFPELSKNKPKSVSYNRYFLFVYGYKFCSVCESIRQLSKFSKDINSWDEYFSLCKECDSKRGLIYKDTHKDKLKISHEKWYNENSHIRAAYQAKRRAIKKQATPVWLNSEHKKEMIAIYNIARKEKLHVDHIVPLNGKYVSGLHVPWNLQLLDKTLNIKKSNYHESEEYWQIDNSNVL